MAVLNPKNILNEIVMSLRNSDILTTTQRNVTTSASTGTLSGSTIITVSNSSVKNIRSVTVGGTAMLYGSQYTVDTNYSGACRITLATTATAAYTVSLDSGTDKIFLDYPRNDLTINSFPRISVEQIDITSDAGGFGNVNVNVMDFSVVVYDFKKDDVRNTVQLIRNWLVTNQNNLYYAKLIKPSMTGPVVLAGEFDKFKDKIMKQNQDFKALLLFEIN